MFGFDVIDADPPWEFELRNAETGGAKSAQAHYETMTLDEIKALPVNSLARGDCLLLLWTCGWAMATGQAHDVARAWGAKPITEMIWNKRTRGGKWRVGPGYRVRTMHEPILVCTYGNPTHKALPSAFDGVAREHSRKPDEFYELVRKATPNAMRRASLFTAGHHHDGFEGWGKSHHQGERR
jgi:N6-adenosine-specific RNA methylase IME4